LGQGLSLQQLADRVGASKPQIDKLERGTRRLTPEWLRRVAQGLGVDVSALLAEGGRAERGRTRVLDTVSSGSDTPGGGMDTTGGDVSAADPVVSGSVSAGLAVSAREPVSVSAGPAAPRAREGDWLPLRGFGRIGAQGQPIGTFVDSADAAERVWRPEPLAGLAEAYAVRMPDATMVPRYQPGQILFVHPYRTPRGGDAVVVRLAGGRFVVGLLPREPGGGLAVERLTPPARLALPPGDVLAVERIVAAEEP
jgi:SOS-response transcriptional repressor LexA